MKDVYISGMNGFIGNHFRKTLEDRQYIVKPIDRTGVVKTIYKSAYAFLDFASYGNYHDQKDIGEIYEANVNRLRRMLESANPINYKAFIVTGSSSEYGQSSIPMHEMLLPKPDTFYASAKVAATALARVWANEFNKPIVAIRPFSVTGPSEQSNHLIPTIIKSCLTGEPMKLAPDPVHDFVDIRDFFEGVWKVVMRADEIKGEVINIGSGVQYSNQEVLDIVQEVTGKKANVTNVSTLRSYDKKLWVADNFRLKSLGWVPEFTLRDSVTDMVKQFKNE
jgi:dolichol-phosphate mannosyltransferase